MQRCFTGRVSGSRADVALARHVRRPAGRAGKPLHGRQSSGRGRERTAPAQCMLAAAPCECWSGTCAWLRRSLGTAFVDGFRSQIGDHSARDCRAEVTALRVGTATKREGGNQRALAGCPSSAPDGKRPADYGSCYHVGPLCLPVRRRRVCLRGHGARRVTPDLPRRSVPLNEDGSTAAIGDYAGQAAKAIENMQAALATSGASLQDVISTRFSSRRPGERTWWLPGR